MRIVVPFRGWLPYIFSGLLPRLQQGQQPVDATNRSPRKDEKGGLASCLYPSSARRLRFTGAGDITQAFPPRLAALVGFHLRNGSGRLLLHPSVAQLFCDLLGRTFFV